MKIEPVNILLIEDNEGDIRLAQEALKDGKVANDLQVVTDGQEALDYLNNRGQYTDAIRPDFILLDLNLPKINGIEVLEKVKADVELKKIPVIVLTTSEREQDILSAYNLQADCYIKKPVTIDKFLEVVQILEDFWISIVKLPKE
ncbi:MAG: chemotaxis family two-component system response regulator Rcp1 [Sphingobacteriales bacterium]|jgi:chemotaxis family two-component system response regulator Rcp1